MKNKIKQTKDPSCLAKSSQREVKDILNTDEKQLIKTKFEDGSGGEREDNKYHFLPGFLGQLV